jgi:hypothetical protein
MLKISYPLCEIGYTLNVPAEDVWDFITDTTRWPKWGPSVTAVDCEERFIRKGSRGRLRIPFGIWIPFVITDYEDKKYWSWSIRGIRATGHRIEHLGEGICTLIFEVPALAAPYLIICWIAIRRIQNLLKRERNSSQN